MLFYPDKLKSNNPAAYGIVDATEISGHRSVASLTELYALKDCILSRSGTNADNDALGQVWHVGGTVNKDYRLVAWADRRAAAGWAEVVVGTQDSALTTAEIDAIIGA
ncbi:MAG: hypothetical protein K2H16_06140 [Prevotella sp.]|nr:hypothetical protein [Prevotella sp.]